MRANQIAVRAALVCGLAGAAWATCSALDDQAAYAGDKPAVAEQPGGLLGHTVRLPEQAAARAKAAVEQATEATPEPTTPAEPETSDGPAPDGEDQGDEPSPDTSDRSSKPAPADPVVDVPPVVGETPPVVVTPPVEAPPAEVPPAELPLPAPTPSTEDAPPVVTLPTTDPAPLPDAEDPTPAPVTVPEVGALPVTIGPVPAVALVVDRLTDQLVTALTSTEPADPAYCADDPDDAPNVARDAIAELVASLTDPAATPRAKPTPGCPGTPDHPAADSAGTASVAATGQTAGPQCLADVTAGIVAPTLARLEHARARSTIPTGRTTHLDPRPA